MFVDTTLGGCLFQEHLTLKAMPSTNYVTKLHDVNILDIQ